MTPEPSPNEGVPIRRQIEVRNRLGIHARPANMIARAAMSFRSKLEISRGNECIDATSIISLLTLGAEQGAILEVLAQGEDAEEAVQAICALFDRCFDEEEDLTSLG